MGYDNDILLHNLIIAAREIEKEHWGDSIALADPCICKICVAIRAYDTNNKMRYI